MPSPTDAPAALPERLADAEGELPTRLRIIADGDLRTMARDSLVGIHPNQQELHEWADLMDEAADALTAAESAREAAVDERDEALTIQAPEDVLEPQWGHNAFRSVLGESYRPKVWSKDRALNYVSMREALAIEGLPDRAHDVIAALIWNRVVVGNNAHHAWEQRDAALARAERAEKALEPFTAPRAIGLMLRPVGTGASPAEPVLVEHVEWFDAARAALAHPAPAEET